MPVPETLLLCEDDSVLGAPFYLMERVARAWCCGSRAQTDPLGDDGRRELAYAMMDTLAALHAVDPADGRARRLRPAGRLPGAAGPPLDAASSTQSRSRDLPGADELRDRLAATVPRRGRGRRSCTATTGSTTSSSTRTTLRVAAVLDWEMATLGDPLTDLGLLLTYWDVLGGSTTGGNPIADGLGAAAGFPSGAELLDAVRDPQRRRRRPACDWYVALGLLQARRHRSRASTTATPSGQTVGAGFDQIGDDGRARCSHTGLAATRRES